LHALSPKLFYRVTAYGSLAAQQSANTVSLTQWVYPGKNITGGAKGGGFLLEIPGLVVQILNPPTHFLLHTSPQHIEIRANVTMMCGCPIGHPPWPPDQFDVMAVIKRGEYDAVELPLMYDEHDPHGIPSRFVNKWPIPKNETGNSSLFARNTAPDSDRLNEAPDRPESVRFG